MWLRRLSKPPAASVSIPTASVFCSTLTGGIGKGGKLPWKLAKDLQNFEYLTSKHHGNKSAIVMGRNTWNSLPKSVRPLRNRLNLVVTNTLTEMPRDVLKAASLKDALFALEKKKCDAMFIVGGKRLYDSVHSKKLVDRIYWTRICGPKIATDVNVELDSMLRDYDVLAVSKTYADKNFTYDFLVLEKKKDDVLSHAETHRDNAKSTEDPESAEIVKKELRRIPLLTMTSTDQSLSFDSEWRKAPHSLPKLCIADHEELQYLSIMEDILDHGMLCDERYLCYACACL